MLFLSWGYIGMWCSSLRAVADFVFLFILGGCRGQVFVKFPDSFYCFYRRMTIVPNSLMCCLQMYIKCLKSKIVWRSIKSDEKSWFVKGDKKMPLLLFFGEIFPKSDG